MMECRLLKLAAITNMTTFALLAFALVSSDTAQAQVAPIDPALEVFRIRCQIDADVDPATGLLEPKVQIQAKARADILPDGTIQP